MPSFADDLKSNTKAIKILDTLLSYYEQNTMENSLEAKDEYDQYDEYKDQQYEEHNQHLLAQLKKIKQLMKQKKDYSFSKLLETAEYQKDKQNNDELYTSLEAIAEEILYNDEYGINENPDYFNYLVDTRCTQGLENYAINERYAQIILDMAQSDILDISKNPLVSDNRPAVEAVKALAEKFDFELDEISSSELTNLINYYKDNEYDSKTTELVDNFIDCIIVDEDKLNNLESIVGSYGEEYPQQLVDNNAHWEMLNVLLSKELDDIKDILDFEDPEDSEDEKYQEQNQELFEQLQAIQKLMTDHDKHSFNELYLHCQDIADDNDVPLTTLTTIAEKLLNGSQILFDDSSYLEYLTESRFEAQISSFKKACQYGKIIMNMDELELPNDSSNDLLKAQQKALDAYEVLEDKYDFDSLEDFIATAFRLHNEYNYDESNDELKAAKDLIDSIEVFNGLDQEEIDELRAKTALNEKINEILDTAGINTKMHVLLSYVGDDTLKDSLYRETSGMQELDGFDVDDNNLYEKLSAIKTLMAEEKCYTLKELKDSLIARNDIEQLLELESICEYLLDPENELLGDNNFLEHLADDIIKDELENYKQATEYTQIIINMILKDLPKEGSDNEMQNAQKKAIEAIKEIAELQDIKINQQCDPQELLSALYYVNLTAKDDSYADSLDNFEECLSDFYENTQTNIRLFKQNINSAPLSPTSPIPTTQSSTVGIRVQNLPSLTADIKAKFKQALDNNAAINDYTDITPCRIQSKPAYKTTVTTSNFSTTITMAKDGSQAQIDGGFDAQKYKLLIELYIRTNDIQSAQDIKPTNIQDPNNLNTANEIIRQCIEDYKQELDIGIELTTPQTPPI